MTVAMNTSMTVASAPWYTSATLWVAVAAIVAVITLAVEIIRWWLSSRRPVLLYSTPVVTSLLSAHAPQIAEGDLKVTFKGQPLTDPHLVTVRVESRSRKDIGNRDFNADKPLVIRLGTSFAAPVSEPTKVLVDKLHIDNSDISIGPCRIRRGLVALLEFVTEGPPHTSHKDELLGIDVRPDNEDYRQQLRRGLVRVRINISALLILIYILIGVFFNTAAPHLPTIAGSVSPLHSWVQYFISVLFWPLSLWHPSFVLAKWVP
jgi:hypothetical protein